MGKPSKNLPDFTGRFQFKMRYVKAGIDNIPNLKIIHIKYDVTIKQNAEFILICIPTNESENFRLGTIYEDVSAHKYKNECGKCISEVKPNGIFYVRLSDSDDNGTTLAHVTKVDKHNRVLEFEGVNNSAGINPNNPDQTTLAASVIYTRID